MRRASYILVGVLAGIAIAAAPGVAAWLTSGNGTASVALAELKPLGVSPAKVEGAWPGDTVEVRADLKNPNARAVSAQTITLTDLHADVAGCATGAKFTPTTDIPLPPGDANDVQVGTLTIPKGVAQKCVGATLQGTLSVEAAYGS